MKENSFNEVLLSVFRIFVGIRLLFSVLSIILSRFITTITFRRLPNLLYFSLADAALLLLYLSWPWLRKNLGKAYLPLALGIATVGPVLENFLAIDMRLTDTVNQLRIMAGQWELVILLLVPLILVSWRYSYKVVIGYCLSLAALDSLLAIFISRAGGPPAFLAISVVSFRSLLFLLVGYVVNRLSTEQRRQTEELAEANRQLEHHAAALEQLTISRERNRMARELHDTLAHSLSAVAVELEAVKALWDNDARKAKEMLDQSIGMTRDGLKEARNAIQALRLTPLEGLGLPISLANLANSMAERGGFSVELDLPDEDTELKPEVEHTIYRITEEALRNAVQHAKARNVKICLTPEDHHLSLNIQDDGIGFSDAVPDNHNRFGLRGMIERAESIGADLKIESQPGQGTTVHLSMEIDQE